MTLFLLSPMEIARRLHAPFVRRIKASFDDLIQNRALAETTLANYLGYKNWTGTSMLYRYR